jgi:Flp pilus assembly protein TadB
MTPDAMLAALMGALAGVGVLLLVLSIIGFPPGDPAKPSLLRASARNPQRSTVRLLVGIAVALVVLAVTRWLVLAVALGLLGAFWDTVFGGAAAERASIVHLDALASWTESLRDTIAGAVGLEQAIPATAATAGAAIRPSLNLLVDRLRIREPLPSALMKFADDLDDTSADLIVGALVLNARLRGPGLREVLTALASSAREELDMRRRVEATRRSTRRSVQIVVGVTLGVAGLLILLNRSYVKPYGSVAGQGFLAISILLFAGGVMWLRRLARIETPERFLTGRRSASGAPAALSAMTVGAGQQPVPSRGGPIQPVGAP